MPDLEAEVEDGTEQENEIAEILTLLKHGHLSQQYGTPLSVDEYLSIVDALDQLNMLTLEEIVDHVQEEDPEKEEGEAEEDDIAAAIKVPSEAEVLKSLVQVKIWARYRGGEVGAQMLRSILKLQKQARRVEQINMKQTTISDFFKPATTTGLPSASSPPARSISEVVVLQDDDVEILLRPRRISHDSGLINAWSESEDGDDDNDEEAGDDSRIEDNDDPQRGASDGQANASASRGRSENDGLLNGRRKPKRASTQTRIRQAQKHRTRGEATVVDAVLMLLKSFVGTGILFLGKAFFNGGILFSVVVLCSIALISLASFLLLVKANLKVPASFGEMGGILYGPKMRSAILTSIVLSQLGFVAAYTVFVAQNLQAFILAVTHCKTLVPIGYLVFGQCLVFLPLSLIRRIAKLSGTALIANISILVGIIYLFQFEIRQLATKGVADVKLFNSQTFPLLIGTAVFTFEGVGLVIPITEAMREPERFPGVLTSVMLGTMVLFSSAGVLGYAAFGNKVQTVVISNLPQNSRFVQALQCIYSIAILLSAPLQLFPAVSILERGIFTDKSGRHK
ncbi:hypothetical protein OC845_003975 [Tilletia horrida]|nr:hypothetical protein OC845_003975 [Tilletia horrida]